MKKHYLSQIIRKIRSIPTPKKTGSKKVNEHLEAYLSMKEEIEKLRSLRDKAIISPKDYEIWIEMGSIKETLLLSYLKLRESILPYIVNLISLTLNRLLPNGLSNLRNSRKNFYKHLGKASAEAFRMSEWFYTPSMEKLIPKLSEVEGINSSYTDSVVMMHFRDSHTLDDLAQLWNYVPLFKDKAHIFRKALTDHTQGLYYSSLALLLTQLEEILTEYLKERVGENEVRKIKASPFSRYKKFRFILNRGDLDFIDDIFAEGLECFVTEEMYQYTGKIKLGEIQGILKDNPGSFIYRYPWSHGLDTDFGTEKNSVKAFLLLDTLAYLISSEEVEGWERTRYDPIA